MTEQKAAPAAPPANLSDAARKILDQVQARQEPPDSDPAQAAEPKQPKELMLDIGGVKRAVSVDDLTKAYLQRDELTATQRAIAKQLAEVGDAEALKSLKGAIEGLSPARRAKVFELLQGGSDDEGEEVGTDDDGEDPTYEPAKPARRGRDPSEERLARIEQVVQALAGEANQRITKQQHETRREAVQRLMSSFPLFKSDPAAASFAEDSILTQLTLDPKANVEQVVQSAAQKLQQLRDKAQADVLEDAGVRPPNLTLPSLKGGATARALKTGEIRRAAMRAINGLK